MTTAARPAGILALFLFVCVCMLATTAMAFPGAGAGSGAASAAASSDRPVFAVDPLIQLAQATPQSQRKRAARPVPQACTSLRGVERRICAECDGVEMFKRIGCQQRVFWSACKGKRLFEDPYCRTHQDQGPPRGEGG